MSSEQPPRGLLFVVSAPSGTGKTTVVERLVQVVPDLRLSRSYTSRRGAGRGNATGWTIISLPASASRRWSRTDAFLEWADVFGNLYGTGAADTERELAERAAIWCSSSTSRARARCARAAPRPIGIFVLPPSFDGARAAAARPQQGLAKRRCGAGWRRRATRWRAFTEYDYVVVNDELEACVDRLRAIVLAERARLRRDGVGRRRKSCRSF